MFFLVPWKIDKTGSVGYRRSMANSVIIAANLILYFCGGYWPVSHGSGPLSVVLYGFSHAGLWHLAVNMWALWIFGNPVNRRLGNAFYVIIYFGTILLLGLFAKFFIPHPVVGSSGALFAVMTVAMLLLPQGVLHVACVAIFPLTIVIGLFAPPKQAAQWVFRWETHRLPMLWALALVPLLFAWELAWFGWNWATAAHLLGMLFGAAAVLVLPSRITTPGRSLAGA
jgi:membrane associated rhomboid family serine protease